MKQFTQTFIAWTLMLTPLYPQTVEWQQSNGPLGGNVDAVIMTDTGSLIAGTWLGGLYRSTDGGTTWVEVNTGLQNPDMTAFLLLPNGDVLVSSFDGDTWEKQGAVPTWGVKDLARDSAGNLYIAMRGGSVFKKQFSPTIVVKFFQHGSN